MLMLADDFRKKTAAWITGGTAGVAGPLYKFRPGWEMWHRVEITAREKRFVAAIDWVKVQDLELGDQLGRGAIGFPDMRYAYAVRKVEVKDLGSPTKYVTLGIGKAWVRVRGKTVKVWVDGEPAAEFDGLRDKAMQAGQIGLQIHLEDASVEFRDIRVRALV